MSKVLNVFYGADRLPYKDQERQVHYPMVGNSFAGASLVDEIRFYAKDLGTENNVFVGIAKRPDGQRGYQVLTYGYDTELNEPYWTFNVSGWFTEKVGNVFVSLNVYQGGVDIEVDEDSGLAIVSGTPIIQATGSVVLSINYAPVMDNGYGAVPTIDVQEALSLVGSKVDTDYLTANYYNKTTIDGKLLLKADLSYVNGFVKTLEVSMDSSTYVLTFTCKDGTGTTISTQSIDLPLESVVVNGEYDSDTQSIILTLQNGNTISIPVSDLVDGLVDTTTFETAIQGIEDELDTKANANEVYTKDEVDTLLSAKADKTATTSLQNQINDLNSRLVIVEEAIIGVDTLTFTALSYSAIPNVSDNLYPLIQSGGLDTKEIKGNSFVHSQLVQNGNFVNNDNWSIPASSQSYISMTVSNNKAVINVIANATSQTLVNIQQGFSAKATVNHKYLVKANKKSTQTRNIGSVGITNCNMLNFNAYTTANATQLVWSICQCSTSGNNYLQLYVFGNNADISTDDSAEVDSAMCFDLTKDFGAGNEPTTYDQAVSMYASKGIDITNYVEYTQGTLIDSKPVKLISRGYNLFDGNLAIGNLSGGTSVWNCHTTNYVKVYGGAHLTFESGDLITNQSNGFYYKEYDENYNQVGSQQVIYDAFNNSNTRSDFVVSNETRYVKLFLYIDGYNFTNNMPTKLSIHLTGSRIGYAPYKAPIEYPITTEVLRSAGSVQDSAVSKKVGVVDLGNLNWTRTEIGGLVIFYTSGVRAGSNYGMLCSKYQYVSSGTRENGQIRNDTYIGSGIAYVVDSSYTDAATFKTAMSGVILNYELATPTEQTATLPTDIEIEKGGSLEVVYDNGYTTPADFVFDCAVYKPLE